MDSQPGRCSILFTDIEGSTEWWDRDPAFMIAALAEHDEVLVDAITSRGGRVLKHTGDGVCAVFTNSADAALAALDIQLSMEAPEHPDPHLRVRIGLHAGTALWSADEPRGPVLNEASRIMSAAHGGQTLMSAAFAGEAMRRPAAGIEVAELGTYSLRGISTPMRLLQLTHDRLAASFPAIRARPVDDPFGSRRGTLFGREPALGELRSIIGAGVLVTLWGPAGVGKTRLALELARRAGPDFVDGVTVVECNVVTHDDALVDAVASTLGVRPRSGFTMTEAVGEALRSRHQLIVLDNCEHVLPAIRRLCNVLSASCTGLALLATSRTPLRLRQEIVFPVEPLRTVARRDDDTAPAVELFVERVRQNQPQFAMTSRSREVVSRICQSLDGLPLAVELAAARVRGLTLTELERSISAVDSSFDDVEPPPDYAHPSLSQAIAWSCDALDEPAQRVFESVSIFAGPFSAVAAGSVVDVAGVDNDRPTATTLRLLVERSVLQVRASDDLVTYQLLDSVRRFGQQRLQLRGATAAHHRRLIDHYRDYTGVAAVHLQGPDEALWVRTIEREFANVRQAQSLAIAIGDVDSAMELMANLFDWALWRMHYELTSWALDAIRLDRAAGHPLFPSVSACAIYGLWSQGNLDEAHRVADLALASEASLGRQSALLRDALASICLFEGRLTEARTWTREWTVLARAEDNGFRLARSMYTTAVIEMLEGNTAEAVAASRATWALARATQSPTAMSFARHAQGLLLRRTSPERAIKAFELAAELAETVDNQLAIGLAQRERAQIEARSSPERALRALHSVIQHWRKADDIANQLLTMRKTARLLAELGDDEGAALLLTALADRGTEELPGRDRALLGALAERLGPARRVAIETSAGLIIDQDLPTVALELIDAALAAIVSPSRRSSRRATGTS